MRFHAYVKVFLKNLESFLFGRYLTSASDVLVQMPKFLLTSKFLSSRRWLYVHLFFLEHLIRDEMKGKITDKQHTFRMQWFNDMFGSFEALVAEEEEVNDDSDDSNVSDFDYSDNSDGEANENDTESDGLVASEEDSGEDSDE